MNDLDRLERLDRGVRLLTAIVAILSIALLVLGIVLTMCCLAIASLVAWPFFGQLMMAAFFVAVASSFALVLLHRQIPAVAREIGRWFAPAQ